MALQPPRWTEVTTSEHAHEREGLRFVQDLLADAEPNRAWSNFEFIADDGSINEVDLLVATPKGVFVVELKHWSGEVSGDAGTWQRRPRGGGPTSSVDNPLLLTNRKAKKLSSLLERPYREMHERRPFLDALVFLSNPDVVCKLAGNARTAIHTTADIEAALTRTDTRTDPTRSRGGGGVRFGAEDARRLTRAMDKIGVRPSRRHRMVGDYELGPQIGAGTDFQEFAATHVSVGTRHRVRIHTVSPQAPPARRRLVELAARREVQVLQGISHEGIERPLTMTETERGPAVVYEDDAGTQRLDLFLNERRESLTLADRLMLVRRLAEALRYAHAKGLTHRSLNPGCIEVCDVDSDGAQYLQVRNWQTGHRADAGLTEAGTRLTSHFADLVDDTAQAYAAPDLGLADPDWIAVDVFGLGACAFEILGGQAPAASFNALLKALRSDDGLRLCGVVDGVDAYVDEVVWSATRPSVADRTATVADFLAGLDVAELGLNEATAGDAADTCADPLGASPGDVLEGGYTVRGNLGSGSTAVVYQVRTPGGDDLVLKLADDPRHNERIRDEAAVLAKCRHSNIVRYHETVEIGGLAGLVLDSAGEQTLRQRLRQDGAQHLDFLGRFGEDLLDALRYLEAEGVSHRDVKPDNLGVAAHSGTHELHLVLFDFSLARAPSEQVRAGTPGYLDPFLALRERWDLYAERYAAAVTLHEMAAGTLPRWGDGRSDPAVTDDALVLDVDLFPAELREALAAFLTRGLARDVADRFGNADEMLRAWRRVFETVDTPVIAVGAGDGGDGGDVLARALATAAVTDPLLTLPFTTRAQNAFGRLGVETVRDLLATPLANVSHMRGVGQKTRREIVDAVKVLAARFADVEVAADRAPPAAAAPTIDGEDGAADTWDLDALVAALLPGRTRRGSSTPDIVAHHLGLSATAGAPEWPTRAQVAAAVAKTPARVSQVLGAARERWSSLTALTQLRDTVAAAVADLGGAATVDEVATEIRTLAGAGEDDRVQTRAAAALRAATDVEAARAEPRWTFGRTAAATVMLATDAATLDYAAALGAAADTLAASDPLPGAQRVVAALGEIPAPAATAALAPQRLVRLAAAASTGAATAGSRMELYPRGLAAERALRLAAPALLGARALDEDEVRDRVRARYPDADALPPRPALDELVAAAGIDLRWDDTAGRYVARRPSLSGLTSLTSLTSRRTVMTATPGGGSRRGGPRRDPAVRDFTARLDASLRDGGFLALVTAPSRVAAATAALAARHPDLATISIEAVLLAHMHARCDAIGAKWDAFVGADADGPQGPHWAKLLQLVGQALPGVEADLAAAPATTALLTRAGLLARYGHVDVLERLRDRCSHGGDTAIFGRWLLVADDDQSGRPRIDRVPLPLLTASQWIRIPSAWLDAAPAGAVA